MEERLVVSPLSPRNFDVFELYKNIEKDSIESMIFNLGYIPISKIVITDGKEGKYAKYVISITKYGQIMAIDLDLSGNSILSDRDILVKKDSTFDIPHSTKIGAINTVENKVDGVLFVMKKGIIIVFINKDLVPSQESYVYARELNSNFELSSNPIPYVIVKLSELKENSSLAQRNIYISTKMLRNSNFEDSKVFMTEFMEKMEKIKEEYELTVDVAFEKIQQLLSSMSDLKRQIESIQIPDSESPDKEKEFYKESLDILVVQNDVLLSIMETMNAFKRYLPVATQLLSDIEKSKDRIGSINTCDKGTQRIASSILTRLWAKNL